MRQQYHFDHHRREGVTNRRRFNAMAAFLMVALLAGTGTLLNQYSFAASSTTFDLNGYKIDTSSSHTGPYQGATTKLVQTSNNATRSSTSNPYYNTGVAASTSGTAFTFSVTPGPYSGWTIKGSTYCYDSGCNTFNQQSSYFAAGSSRKLTLYPSHVYNWRWIWEYKAPTTPSLSGRASGSTASLSWTASTQAGGAAISYYYIYNGSTKIGQLSGSARSYATSMSCGTNYSYTVRSLDQYNHASASSNAYVVSGPACPPAVTPAPVTPRPATPKPATPRPVAPAPVTSAPKPGSTQGSPVAPTAVADTTAPAAPEGFTAAASDNAGYISLSWTASTDPSGIKSYRIERSTDQATWSSIADNLTETSYEDASTHFSTHYYYRMTATDGAGNISGYATADAATGDFQQNAGSGTDSTLMSDDSVASVVIPAGALPDGADCSVVQGDTKVNLAKDQAVLAGPYQLLCKDVDGNQVATLSKVVTWKYALAATKLKGYKTPIGVVFDDSGKGSTSKASFDSKLHVLKFDQASGFQSIVLASKKKSIPFNLIVGILIVMALFAGAIMFMLRRRQKQNYSDYIRSKYYDI